MNPPGHTARRATLDDLPALIALWRTEKLDVPVLEKRFTEFQLAVSADGKVAGAIGLLVDGTHGLLHSESFSDFGLADKLRVLLWERLQSVARNRGLTRLWLREDTLFFRGEGFDTAAAVVLEKLPASFGSRDDAWWTLKLKDELNAILTPEQELAIFQQLARDGSEKALRQARVAKYIATCAAILFFIGLLVIGYYMKLYYNQQRRDGAPPGYRR